MSYLRYLCLFAHSGVYYILCCVFVLFFVVLCTVSLDCPFCFIVPSVFSNVYIKWTSIVILSNVICSHHATDEKLLI